MIENKIDSVVPAYMHIANYFEYIVDTSVGTGVLPEGTRGIIRRSIYDKDKGNIFHTCIFPVNINGKEYPVEIILENYDNLNRGYSELPLGLKDLWDGDNQLIGKWKRKSEKFAF